MAKRNRFEKVYTQGTIELMEIWRDNETGVNYLFHVAGNTSGFTPLLGTDGKPVVTLTDGFELEKT